MPVKMFVDDENGYQQWITNHPDGYVLTTVRDISPDYMSLHKATCRMISRYMKNMAADAFTARGYIKIFSESTCNLLDWIKQNDGTGFTKLCSICAPTLDDCNEITDGLEDYYSKLARDVANSLSDPKNRKKRLNKPSEFPETISVTTTVYKRNPDVIAEVLERANGKCEECGKPAPFNRASNGSPYLEVHHRTPLSEHGKDTIDNALALCPNCHREAHFSE